MFDAFHSRAVSGLRSAGRTKPGGASPNALFRGGFATAGLQRHASLLSTSGCHDGRVDGIRCLKWPPWEGTSAGEKCGQTGGLTSGFYLRNAKANGADAAASVIESFGVAGGCASASDGAEEATPASAD